MSSGCCVHDVTFICLDDEKDGVLYMPFVLLQRKTGVLYMSFMYLILYAFSFCTYANSVMHHFITVRLCS